MLIVLPDMLNWRLKRGVQPMKALVYNKDLEEKIKLVEKEKPTIQNPRDAIVKVTLSTICTSDLHIMHGLVPRANNKITLGHEFVGEIVELGNDIKNLSIGDRVSANCETFCGECYFCKRGYINNCEKGGWEIGCRIDGCQAEYIRVPYADTGLTKIPENVTNENALFVGDILSSGYFGAKMCEIKKGDTIAIIGAGPVGLCAMICSKLLGAEKIIVIDTNENRLNIAKQQNLANYFLNPQNCNIEQEIKNLTNCRGADGVIECAGGKTTFELAWKIARPNAIVGVVAMYEDNQTLPLPQMYGKNLTFKTGGVDAIYCKELLELISQGKINTDFLITQKYKLSEIEEAYKFFAQNKNSCLKVAITQD